MLNSEIEYFILRLTPKGTISHIWRQETMHLLMTTYRQDIMTNFSCVCDGSTVYPFFRAVYQLICTNIHCTCPCQQFKVFMLNISFTKNGSKAIQNRLSVILIMPN